MYRILLLAFICVSIVSCNTSAEKKDVPALDLATMQETVKTLTQSDIMPLPDMSEHTDSINGTLFEGFCSPIKGGINDKYHLFVAANKGVFKNSGYLLFVFSDYKRQPYIGAIKSDDELDIVRWRQTDGINYNLTTIDIVAKLADWNEQIPLVVNEVDMDVVWITFEKSVADMDVKALAEDIYQFSPDVVDQGTGDIQMLEKTLIDMNGVYLWWD